MFTGLVEALGTVCGLRKKNRGTQLEIAVPIRSLKLGASLAINGCCLTVAAKKGNKIITDLSAETLRRTNLGKLRVGDRVNLERAVRLQDRLGGHLVQGHVDGLGKILAIRHQGRGAMIEIGVPSSLRRYLIPKGSITVDGISMTVNQLKAGRFTLAVIPHTLQQTNLRARKVGDWVNLEVDIVGKYIESFVK